MGVRRTGSVGSATEPIEVRRTIASYTYDDTGIRVTATEQVLTDADNDPETEVTETSYRSTEYLNDPQNPTGYSQVLQETERNAADEIIKTIISTLGLDVLTQATYGQLLPSTGQILTLLYDGHGSTRQLAEAAGLLAIIVSTPQTFHYDAYGNAVGFNPANAATSLLYSGEQWDQKVQMQYLRARYYSAESGRFVARDTYSGRQVDPQSFHKYAYTNGNPVSGVDPLGLYEMISTMGAANSQGNMTATNTTAVVATRHAAMGGIGHSAAALTMKQIVALGFVGMASASTVLYPWYEAESLNEVWNRPTVQVALRRNTLDRIKNRRIWTRQLQEEEISPDDAKRWGLIGKKDIYDEYEGSKIPIFVEHLSTMYHVAANGLLAQLEGHAVLLNYLGDSLATAVNRDRATSPWKHLRTATLNQLDEYPFASTFQGGFGARVAAVPESENSQQQTECANFLTFHQVRPGDAFLVLVTI